MIGHVFRVAALIALAVVALNGPALAQSKNDLTIGMTLEVAHE